MKTPTSLPCRLLTASALLLLLLRSAVAQPALPSPYHTNDGVNISDSVPLESVGVPPGSAAVLDFQQR